MNQDPRAPRAEIAKAPDSASVKEPVSAAIKKWRMSPFASAYPSGYKLPLCAIALLLAVMLVMMTVLTASVCVLEGDFHFPTFQKPSQNSSLGGVAGQDGDRPFADGQSGNVQLPTAENIQIIPANKLYSSHAALASLSTGEVIASRKMDESIYPASMTKVMTLIVIAENLPREDCLRDTIKVSQEAYDAMTAAGASGVGMKTGDQYSVEAMLYALMLQSDGIAATELAKYVAGSEEDFVELMNLKAKRMGLKNTHFTNPTGLYHKDHVSSCRDIASIMAYAMNMELCRKILKTEAYSTYCTTAAGEKIAHTFYHKLTVTQFDSVSPHQPNGVTVVAGKTGFTDESRFCLVTYAESKDGRGYVCVTASSGSYKECIADYLTVYNNYIK